MRHEFAQGLRYLLCLSQCLVCVLPRRALLFRKFCASEQEGQVTKSGSRGERRSRSVLDTKRGVEICLHLETNRKVIPGCKMIQGCSLPTAELNCTQLASATEGWFPNFPQCVPPVFGSEVGRFCPLELTHSGVALEVLLQRGVTPGFGPVWLSSAPVPSPLLPLPPFLGYS